MSTQVVEFLLGKAKGIVAQAEKEGRSLTPKERSEADGYIKRCEEIKENERLREEAVEFANRWNPESQAGEPGTPARGGMLARAVKAAGFDLWTNSKVVVPSSAIGLGKAITFTGGVGNLGVEQGQPVTLGFDEQFLASAVKQQPVDRGVTSVQALQETARTFATPANMIRAIDATTQKPETAITLTLVTAALNQVAHVVSDIPIVIFEQTDASNILENEMRLGVRDAVDQLVYAALTAAGLPNNAFGTDPLIEKIRKARSVVQAAGYAPDTVALSPANMESLDLLKDTAGHYQFATSEAGSSASPGLWGMRAVVSKRVVDPLVFDSNALATLYASPLDIRGDASRGFRNNTVDLRGELHAVCVRERAAAGLRIGA